MDSRLALHDRGKKETSHLHVAANGNYDELNFNTKTNENYSSYYPFCKRNKAGTS